MSNNGQQQQHRRATSLGKGHLRSPWSQQQQQQQQQQRPGSDAVAARLARTSSWSDVTGLIAGTAMVHHQNQQQQQVHFKVNCTAIQL